MRKTFTKQRNLMYIIIALLLVMLIAPTTFGGNVASGFGNLFSNVWDWIKGLFTAPASDMSAFLNHHLR